MEECGESNFQVPQKNENFIVNQFFTLGNIWSRWEKSWSVNGKRLYPAGVLCYVGQMSDREV
jgi:hypothetical protein